MDAKEYLEAYSNYARIEKQCREECKAEREALQEIVLYNNRSATGAWRKENAQIIQDCINFCNGLQERADEAVKEKNAIIEMIKSVPGMEGNVLHFRYVDGLIWEDICERLFYSWSGVFKCHNKALIMVQEKLDAMDHRESREEAYLIQEYEPLIAS